MLTQSEADLLISMRKIFTGNSTISIPPGTDQTYELMSEDKREKFLFDIWRATFRISKIKYQNRGRNVIVLIRLDINSSPHTNPDGSRVGTSHLHLYREGYEDKWAYEISASDFTNLQNIEIAFYDFCRYCHIENTPPLQGVLQL